MSDIGTGDPDHACLFDVASEQHGYFTVDQARTCGFGWRALHYHAKRGRFLRLRRGLYRLRDYPPSAREELVAAWLSVGKDDAAISHDSALDLLDLSDVIPNSIHLTVPRSRRGLIPPPAATIHTASRPLQSDEITTLDGMRVTSAARTIADAAEAGIGPEQIELAVFQSLSRALTTPDELRRHAATRGTRVTDLVDHSITRAQRSLAAARASA